MLDVPPQPALTAPAGAQPGLESTVVVALLPRAATSAGDHLLLRDLVARLTGVGPSAVTLAQRCPNCGQTGHGPLSVELAASDPADAPALPGRIHVSLSRAARFLAVAVTGAGPVGIDVESVAALASSPVASALCSPVEAVALSTLAPAALDTALASLWTSKEAVLKAAGVGLRVDPRDLTIEPVTGAADPRLAHWPRAPFQLDGVHLLSVPAPEGTVVTVAVVCAQRPAVVTSATN
ncbi:4'-phosphopantetheinyl transferase family protein [Cryobacterium arcticum]|uniref:4'-phosphopantetheinyl transferase domain-containing protein n=1 Tax=Cryobacterium arcticum TaxID=670052 RepID=A0A317ZTH7_9MICO|nr:4'-phosphopantetheinyl transferase superfamily protein [Cryobacterium arcticum]PXA68433.1 hypothetical protein CTB96_17690 [Cryobacterium arcticum]